MKSATLAPERLDQLLAKFPASRIAVVGDFFLDKYLDVDPSLAEPSVETGKPAHQVVGVRTSPGAAGTVIANLAALGAGALFAVGFTGDDGEGWDLRKGLGALRCNTDHLHCAAGCRTPTYLKPRNAGDRSLAGEHPRYDTKNRLPTSAAIETEIIRSIDLLLPSVDAVVVLDQVEQEDCGVVTSSVRSALAERAAACRQIVFWADSRRRIHHFRNMIVKPNQFEAVGRDNPAPGEQIDLAELRRAAQTLRQQNGAPVVATCGARGIAVTDPKWTIIPAVELVGKIDPTGAGDSASAAMVLSLCAGAQLPEAAIVGNLVASITATQLATTGVARPEQLPAQLALWQRQRTAPKENSLVQPIVDEGGAS